MKIESHSQLGFFRFRSLLGLTLCLLGLALAAVAFQLSTERAAAPREDLQRDLPTLGQDPRKEPSDLSQLEQYWSDRVTYPTGNFDPAWVRQAADQDALVSRSVPAGLFPNNKGNSSGPALDTVNFTALGPKPARMTGCSGCFDYTTTEGRINDIVIDPTTTTNGSIVAYSGSVGGGVWKTTNCCSATTTWSALTDDPLIATIAIDTVTIDPNNHNTIYAGTGDQNYGSFSMGSQGILKSTDGGNSWIVLGADVFGSAFTEPPGQFPQYNAVGKVRVDPNNRNNVVAGTKRGLYISHDGGVTWTQAPTNSFSTQRQDITGLELSNIGGTTRIIAAVGTRGFPTTVQYDLGLNGANGIYSATMPAAGVPTFTSIASNTNGFVFGTSVGGSPYTTGANMNAGSGVPCNYPITGGTATFCGGASPPNGGANNLGRIDIAVAPSNPSIIYAQVASIDWNTSSGCGSTVGCQLGAWVSANGGISWTFMAGSAGASLASCAASGGGSGSAGSGDYPQNWYDQGIKVDPNNPDRVFFDTFDIWLASRTGTAWYDTSCGYTGVTPKPVHVDQHALAFLPGSSDILLVGNDGGIHGTTNASVATLNTIRPTWFNADTGLNTIEFYSGDISGNFATSLLPQANGGAQDNGSMSVTFSGSPTGPVQWQLGKGGDGFYARIDPVGTGTSLRYWQGNNSGTLNRCTSNCSASGAVWLTRTGGWTADQQSFVLPYDIFHGGISGGDDCEPAGATTGCGRLIAGTTRVWETITGATATNSWYITDNPPGSTGGPNLCKGTLGNRSFINQVKYSPKYQSVAIVGTNDGNVQIGFNLGTGVASQANWVNVTGNNVILPNRPILGIALDPTVPTANVPVGYAAVGGFNANTPFTPGHLFQVTCTSTCGSFTWLNKTGNLPDIPVDSVIVNPKFPKQVFAGTDWGVYFTNDISVASPAWSRFENGLPHAMVWDMQVDRGATTLSVWTRSRGAYVWPLPSGPASVTLTSAVSRLTHGAAGAFDINMPLTGTSGVEDRVASTYNAVFTFDSPVTSGQVTVLSGTATVGAITFSGNSMTAQLTGVTSAEIVTLHTQNINGDGQSHGDVAFGFLAGDADASRLVGKPDQTLIQGQINQPVTSANFREDLNADGRIKNADVNVAKTNKGHSIP